MLVHTHTHTHWERESKWVLTPKSNPSNTYNGCNISRLNVTPNVIDAIRVLSGNHHDDDNAEIVTVYAYDTSRLDYFFGMDISFFPVSRRHFEPWFVTLNKQGMILWTESATANAFIHNFKLSSYSFRLYFYIRLFAHFTHPCRMDLFVQNRSREKKHTQRQRKCASWACMHHLYDDYLANSEENSNSNP